MGSKALVENISAGQAEPLIDEGANLLGVLDEAGFPVTAALWLLDPETRTWKLVIASPKVDTGGPLEAYRDLQKYVTQDEGLHLHLQDIALVGPHAPLVDLLRHGVRTRPRAIDGIRFTANSIDNVFIADAYIYRVA